MFVLSSMGTGFSFKAALLYKPLQTLWASVDGTPLQRVGIAVSGGIDSVFLMMQALSWSRAKLAVPQWVILHVDHRLRCESADDAAWVQALAERYHLPCHIMSWQHAGIDTAIQKQARQARYHLLAQAARKYKLDCVLTAHHLDDHIETLLMRQQRRSHFWGMSGIQPIMRYQGIPFLRPLLSVPRQQIDSFMRAHHLPWREDSSNQNTQFERVRIRQSRQGSNYSLLATAQHATEKRQHIAIKADNFIKHHLDWQDLQQLRFDIPAFSKLSYEHASYVLALIIRFIGGHHTIINYRRLEEFCHNWQAKNYSTQTLYRCCFRKNPQTDTIICQREFRNLPLPMPLKDWLKQGDCLWDGRFAITYQGNITDLCDNLILSPLSESVKSSYHTNPVLYLDGQIIMSWPHHYAIRYRDLLSRLQIQPICAMQDWRFVSECAWQSGQKIAARRLKFIEHFQERTE